MPKRSRVSEDNKNVITIPDEAIYYIVSNYMQQKTNVSGISVLLGISAETVENVLQLFIDWASLHGYTKNGVLTIGGHKID